MEEDNLDLQSEATIDLIESITFYMNEYKHTFESNKDMAEHIHYMIEVILQNSREKN